MFIALDSNGNRIDVKNAEKGNDYFCPVCNGRLRVREGSVKIKHFSHISKTDCDDFTIDMSEWHRNWQEQFPLKNREVVIVHNGEKHRADVLACGHVIEFQHSPISLDEFERRNSFYTSAGKKVIWVFDLTEEKSAGKIFLNKEIYLGRLHGHQWFWLYSKRMFKNFAPQENKNVILFFQMEKATFSEKDAPDYIKRVVGARQQLDGISFDTFQTLPFPGTKEQLLDWIKNREDYEQKETEQRKPVVPSFKHNTYNRVRQRSPQTKPLPPSDGLFSVIPAPTATSNERITVRTPIPNKEEFLQKERIIINGVHLVLCTVCNEVFPQCEMVDYTYSTGICRQCSRKQNQ